MEPDLADALAAEAWIAGIEQQVSHTQIGVNVGYFSGSRANNIVPFINQMKGARPWDDPADTGLLRYDERGYPLNVPSGYVVSQLLVRSADLAGIAPHTGRFRLYGEGFGVISLVGSSQGRIVNKVRTDILPVETIGGVTYWYLDFDFNIADEDIGQLRMQIDSLQTGSHLTSLALVHHSHLPNHRAGEVFTPELVADLAVYRTLRFMDWMRANKIDEDGDGWGPAGSNWTSPTPEKRYIDPDYYTFHTYAGGARNEGRFESSVPIEYIVRLANRVDADPWINLPVDITDARAERLGAYVAQNLDDGLTPRWEYGNELFNSSIGFEGYRYSVQMAQATFPNYSDEGPWAAAEWAAYRGPQVYTAIKNGFDAQDRVTRFVAPGWAFSGSLRRDGSLTDGYLVRYFDAVQARQMPETTLAPLDIVTDYAVAMYFGGTLAPTRPDGDVVDYILETVQGADAQAQVLADWLLFGVEEDNTVHVDPDRIEAAGAPVVWSRDLDIAVTALIKEDIDAGLDPLRDLDRVLRLNGTRLQYRGILARRWTDVLEFTAPPPVTLDQMITNTQLVGYGGTLFGEVYAGTRSGLALSKRFRIDAHADYARALGLNFVAYEGGSHVSYPTEQSFAMYDAYNTGTAGARVMWKWLELMSREGVDEYLHWMSHSRTDGNDWWGVQDYVGQDVSRVPMAAVIHGAANAYAPRSSEDFTGPLRRAESIRTTPTGALIADMGVTWAANDAWSVLPDGGMTEEAGTAEQLRLAQTLPVDPRQTYRVEFDVSLTGAASTGLRVVARALGGEVVEVARWQEAVEDGTRVVIDLAPLQSSHERVTLVVQRTGATRNGALTLRNANVIASSQ